eukprot:scaffold13572_cov52-Phaeocystis_antarctica.AAC.3
MSRRACRVGAFCRWKRWMASFCSAAAEELSSSTSCCDMSMTAWNFWARKQNSSKSRLPELSTSTWLGLGLGLG